MRPTSADGGELPFWGIGLSVFVVAPTGDSSVGAYSARVLITSIKGGEGFTWWAVGVYSTARSGRKRLVPRPYWLASDGGSDFVGVQLDVVANQQQHQQTDDPKPRARQLVDVTTPRVELWLAAG